MIKQVKGILGGWLENFEKFTVDVIYGQGEGRYINVYKCLLMGVSKFSASLYKLDFFFIKTVSCMINILDASLS